MIGKKFNIRPVRGTWITCYIWDNEEDMHEYTANKAQVPKDGREESIACFMRPGRLRFDKDNNLTTRKVGELHFVTDEFGAGVVAHEIQHFLSSWITWMGWGDGLLDEYCEPISDIAETLTKQFWNNFYEEQPRNPNAV